VNQTYRPTDERELQLIIAEHARTGQGLEVQGIGSKLTVGRPLDAQMQLSMRNFRGITLHEPSELVIAARAGTSLVAIEAELAKSNLQLAFEPIDLGPMLGIAPQQTTAGGMTAINMSGARRITAGSVRDHVLGIRAINGRGEAIRAGGRVMKNVAGYDLCRGLTGSWGTLAVTTEVTLKALPKAEETRTLVLFGQPDEIAIEILCAAMATPYEVSGTIHLQAPLARRLRNAELRGEGKAVTALRIESFSSSIAYRAERLKELFSAYGEILELEHAASIAFWEELRQLSYLQGSSDPVWRISTSPRMGPRVAQAIAGYMQTKAAFDWSGGLLWLEVPASADAGSADIRRVIAMRGGHATLIRADVQARRTVEVFQPLEAGPARITRQLKEAFDPARIFNRGRMYAGV
jgi:glycolate oxidase FAD binding subunit